MKIISKGNKNKLEEKENTEYVTKCFNCGTKFVYKYKEIECKLYSCTEVHVEREVKCPNCKIIKRHSIFTKKYKGDNNE